MKAGIDFGTTLVKAVWKKGDYRFASTAEMPLEQIIENMKSDSIRKVHAAGINNTLINDFEVYRTSGDQVQNEIELQAKGAKELLSLSGHRLEKFLIVSMGTGTSYTFVGDTIERFPLEIP